MQRVIRQMSFSAWSMLGLACQPMDELSDYSSGSAVSEFQVGGADAAPPPEVLGTESHAVLPNATSGGAIDRVRAGLETRSLTDEATDPSGENAASEDTDPDAADPCASENDAVDPSSGICYSLSRASVSWFAARAACAADAAGLVTISSADVEAFLVERFGVTFWTGANDRAVEGQFEWDSGAAFDFSSFDVDEPNNLFGVQDCVENVASGGGWHDRECGVRNRFVCERAGSNGAGE